METVLILLRQVIFMFILAGIGFLMVKCKKIDVSAGRSIGNILIYISLPAVIISGFRVDRTTEHINGMIISWVVSLALIMLSTLISSIVFRKDAIACFASAFANPGFFGIPLIIASISPQAVFYVAPFIFFTNIFQWTYGTYKLTGGASKITLIKIIKAPFFIAMCIGLVLFFTQFQLPEIVDKCLSTVAELNTPLAMFSIGIYLADTKLKDLVIRGKLYAVMAVRQVAIPIISLVLLSLVGKWLTYELRMALLIVSACPVGSNVAVYAQLYNKDHAYAVETVVVSTLFAIITVPLIVWIAIYIF